LRYPSLLVGRAGGGSASDEEEHHLEGPVEAHEATAAQSGARGWLEADVEQHQQCCGFIGHFRDCKDFSNTVEDLGLKEDDAWAAFAETGANLDAAYQWLTDHPSISRHRKAGARGNPAAWLEKWPFGYQAFVGPEQVKYISPDCVHDNDIRRKIHDMHEIIVRLAKRYLVRDTCLNALGRVLKALKGAMGLVPLSVWEEFGRLGRRRGARSTAIDCSW